MIHLQECGKNWVTWVSSLWNSFWNFSNLSKSHPCWKAEHFSGQPQATVTSLLCFYLEVKKARYGRGVACPCPAVESEVRLGLPSAELGCRTYSEPEQGPAWETGRGPLLGHFCGNVCANRSMKAEMRCWPLTVLLGGLPRMPEGTWETGAEWSKDNSDARVPGYYGESTQLLLQWDWRPAPLQPTGPKHQFFQGAFCSRSTPGGSSSGLPQLRVTLYPLNPVRCNFLFGQVTWHADLPQSGINPAPPAVGHQGNPHCNCSWLMAHPPKSAVSDKPRGLVYLVFHGPPRPGTVPGTVGFP